MWRRREKNYVWKWRGDARPPIPWEKEWAATEAMTLAAEHSTRHTGGVLACPLCRLIRERALSHE